jgi:hypothetical protein
MSADGYVLIKVGESNADACLDVVFVHGITGDPLTTWGASEPELEWPLNQILPLKDLRPKKLGDFWPRWILEDVNEALQRSQYVAGDVATASINVWSLGYPAPLRRRQDPFAYTESLRQAVLPSLTQLQDSKIGVHEGRGVVFIAHSLGGLITKAMLDVCEHHRDYRGLLDRTRGVAFLATPHSGAALASLFGAIPDILKTLSIGAKALAWLAGTPVVGTAVQEAAAFGGWYAQDGNQLQWLKQANPTVRRLAASYRRTAVESRIATLAFYETQPFKGLRPQGIAWVVDASNADPGVPGCEPEPAPGCDHAAICKPASRDTPLYTRVRHWVAALATQQRRGTGVPVLHDALPKLLERVRNDKTYAAINEIPKRLENIPAANQFRVNFSKKFRGEITTELRGELGKLLRDDRDLLDALEKSEWDLDQLVLCLWLGDELKRHLERIATVLKTRAGYFEIEGGPPPTAILTYRLVDALRLGLTDGLRVLLPQLDVTYRNIDERFNEYGDCDEKGRTRRLLDDGGKLLQPALHWRKPPKTAESATEK